LEFDGGLATQGELVKFNIQITNNGNAPLDIKAAPDCSCVSVMRGGQVGPGESRLFPALIDLTDVVGDFDKSIYVYSNDLDKNVVRVPIRVKSKPLFRLIAEGDGYVLMKKGGTSARVFLVLPEGTQMTPKTARFEGLDAEVRFKGWQGELADPGLNEPAKPRKGYVFDVTIKDEAPVGQTIGNLFIDTDHPKYKRLQANLVIQSGIVSMPERVFYGEIPAAPRRSTFVVTRPGKGFKILSADADVPNLSLSYEAQKENWEYRFTVQFDGKAPTGPLSATITIKTDDPSQPVIKVPVTASIR
jgi:hypothetical protein